MKVVIVGGVAGGASAACRLRRLSEETEIVLLEKGPYVSYANCGLPYFIGGVIRDRERLLVAKPEMLRSRFRIDVRVSSEAVRINREKKTVSVRQADGKQYEESYDKLILSPGGVPKRPNFPGADGRGIFTVRDVPDAAVIDRYIREKQVKRAVVVGAGFIGVEMAENLKGRGLDVAVVEFTGQAVAALDPEMAAILHTHIRENGVNLLLNTGVKSFEQGGPDGLRVSLTDGQTLDAGLAILSAGIAPDSALAKDAGLELGIRGSIKVDSAYRTSDPDIYAVGDAIQVRSAVTGEDTLLALAGPANKQGRAAGENVLGKRTVQDSGVQGSSVLKVFGLTAASTGLNEKQLKQRNLPYLKTYVHPGDHAAYYPGASQISMKLLFAPDGKIYGAQAVGRAGADKRIDVIATAQRLGGTVYDLEKLELCYAPPYSSAKDPVNMLGFTAANILRGDVKPFYWDEVDGLDRSKVTLLDVRTVPEAQAGAIEGSVNIPLDDLRSRMEEIPKYRPVYAYCAVGLRGYVACRILMQHGFDAYNLSGGYKTYIASKGQEPPTNVNCVGVQKPLEDGDPPKGSGSPAKAALSIDACGLQCPGPILQTAEGLKKIKTGEVLEVRASDPGYASDIRSWCGRTGNQLLSVEKNGGELLVSIRKGEGQAAAAPKGGNDKSIIVFSGDLDKAIASLIIANGAASMDRKVTMFFTFWGLNILRKSSRVPVKKNFTGRMFGAMMPRGTQKLKLSHLNLFGAGSRMIRNLMRENHVDSPEELLKKAMNSGVRIIACQMSMDLMGIRREELIDGVETAGVATFLAAAEQSDTTLFI